MHDVLIFMPILRHGAFLAILARLLTVHPGVGDALLILLSHGHRRRPRSDFRDRNRVSADEDYEVEYFAQKAGLTTQQVRELIKKHGNDRATLEREAKAMEQR
ncbi:DUF3606 domain-containing protein [Mesorhizobium sp. ORM8.1]